ncbi:hypothetical protein [Micromonospora sp. CB01531]|uniref:hypothetical protein n=1 Tax=Micromonospora sp. CB01531 TaxID=1718947 RepID=UPI000A57345A|nr:hypothetical protein [Micromonospora sp. CB01531]
MAAQRVPQVGAGLALSTVNTYSADGIDMVDTLGPTSLMVLENDVADPDGAGPLEAIPVRSRAMIRRGCPDSCRAQH